MGERDRITCVVWLGISVFAGITALNLGVGTWHNPGSGFLLFGTALLLAIFTVALFGLSFLKKNETAHPADAGREPHWGRNIIVIAALIGYCLALQKLGYVVATFGLMLVLFGLGKMKPRAIVLAAVLTVLISYCLFGYFLKTPLPKGVLGF